jgi:ABC-type ATPase with predicted acetyltransferase domain
MGYGPHPIIPYLNQVFAWFGRKTVVLHSGEVKVKSSTGVDILLWWTKADQATFFEINKYQESDIIHGELEISRLDKDGKITWQALTDKTFYSRRFGNKAMQRKIVSFG